MITGEVGHERNDAVQLPSAGEKIVTIFGGAKCCEADVEYVQARRVGAVTWQRLGSRFAPVAIWV